MLLKNKLPFWIALNSYVEAIVSGVPPLSLPKAKAKPIKNLIAFGGTEQRNLPAEYTQVNYVTNTAQTMINTGVRFDFSKNYEIELKASGVTGSWYILQARETSGSPISGISGSMTGNVIGVNFDGTYVAASQISRVFGHIYYVKGTINNGNLTLYVKDETAGTEETVTGTYTPRTGQSVDIGLFGNIAGNYVDINSDVYFVRIKENDTVVMDYVPARQSATAGFYDKVSGTFKTASNLVADGNAVPTPDYPMDIICNNGVLKYGNVSKNLFDEDYPNVSNSMKYLPIYLGPGTYTCSYSFPHHESGTSLIYFLNGNVSAGASNGVNQVDASNPRTVSSSTGYVTIAYRNGSGIGKPGEVPSDYNCMLASGGTETPYEPYRLAVYTDGLQETINIHTKNLFDEQWNRNTGTSTAAATWGQVVSAPSWSTSGLVPVKAGQQYTVSYNTTVQIYVFYYESDGTMQQSYETTSGTKKTFTVPAGATHIRLQVNKSSEAAIADLETQLETGATATTHVPYFNGGTATAEMLLKVGTYTDQQEIIDGTVTRKVGIKVMTGNETFQTGTNGWISEDTITNNLNAIYIPICTHFAGTDTTPVANSNTVRVYYTSQNVPRVYFGVDKTISEFSSTTAFQQWLADQYAAGTPVTIIYPLSQEITEQVTPQPMQTTQGDNTCEITQASMSGLELSVKYIKGA